MGTNERDKWTPELDDALLQFLSAERKTASDAVAWELRSPGAFSAHCPDRGSYMELASGVKTGSDAEELISHAAFCSACGALLALSLRALEGEPTAEEAAAIAKLPASGSEWQQRISRELAASPAQKQPILGWSRGQGRVRWLIPGAIAAGVLAVAWLIWSQRQARTPERELATAYTQARTFELRVPGAKFAALSGGSHTRGSLDDHEAAPLLEARAQLVRELERAPQDAHWLELEARADILEERYDSATAVLDPLVAQGSPSPELLLDTATAYFQRGLISGSELDRSTALDCLLRADKLAPTDPVILFNEAIVMEDRGQLINAVEVWNRFLTVERDPEWLAEGKRKLAALEQTLNRLKSHQSRIQQLLVTPSAMNSLAADPAQLAALDEELSSYELEPLIAGAFPEASSSANGSQPNGSQNYEAPAAQSSHQARGSPCPESCLAARTLLHAIASSLERNHQDFWLDDLLSADLTPLPDSAQQNYKQALRLLAQATQDDIAGEADGGARLSQQAQGLFHSLRQTGQPGLKLASQAGERRATVEHLFALQRQLNFKGCRAFAEQLRAKPTAAGDDARYPWIDAQKEITQQICYDTPATRAFALAMGSSAKQLAQKHQYYLLESRIGLMLSAGTLMSGDEEAGEQMVLGNLRQLYGHDAPPYRIANTICEMTDVELVSTLPHELESTTRECLQWYELAGNTRYAAIVRMSLAQAELRIGDNKEAENQFHLAQLQNDRSALEGSGRANFAISEFLLAQDMLESGNQADAAQYLSLAAPNLKSMSHSWLNRNYAVSRGMLELELGHFDQAKDLLESEIRDVEVHNASASDRSAAAAFAQQDHDLYGELAATWLAQGRSPESVLALWERFRLRSRGLPVRDCRDDALDCEQTRLPAAQRRLGQGLLVGQIVLMDRVLIYRADRDSVHWSEQRIRRQPLMDTAQAMETAVGSPYTKLPTVNRLGEALSRSLLPQLPVSLAPDAMLFLEPDPMLQNLPWPVMPTAAGPLGLQYALSESRSVLGDEPAGAPVEALLRTGFVRPDPSAGNSSERNASTDRALVVGASMAAEGEPPLPEALQEAESVHDFLPGSKLLVGDQATTGRLSQLLSSASLFHFAGHAVLTADGTRLLLAPDARDDDHAWVDGAFLRLHPPRRCRLAVLSACETGTRRSSWHHPLQDMVETLSALGVPEVVATRWQVNSEASLPLMNAFYAALDKGATVAEALRTARRLQSVKNSYSNPYYWGAYYVTGGLISRPKGEIHAGQGQ